MSTPPIMSTPPFMPQQQTAQDFLTQLLTHQQNTTGMTQVQPNVPPHQVPQPHPFQKQPLQPSQAYGPGQGGAKRSAQIQNFATAVSNNIGTLVQKNQEKKAREQQKVFDNFATYSKGVQDAQGQMQEAKTMLQKAATMGDTPEGKQLKEQGTQMLQQAQQAYQQNVTNLNDLTTGKNEKNSKILAKGYGVDDKNANTPERKAAIAAIQKTNPGMSDKSANLTSHMPATMGLSPQAQQQQTVRQAGLLGNPATQGQVLKALTDQHNQALKHGIDEAKVSLSAYKIGLIPESQEDGTYKLRPMTAEEKGQYQLTTKGVLAWTKKDGKYVAALRNPSTNQIIPGTENPDILPPAYLTERIRVGEFTFTDKDGNVFRVPTFSRSTPVTPGDKGTSPAPATGGTKGTPKAGAGRAGSTTTVGAQPTPSMPKGTRAIGKTTDPEANARALIEHRMAPVEMPGFGKSREQALRRAQELDPNYNAASADIDYTQARNPGVQATLKYLTSLTGQDGKSGNLGELVQQSNKISRTDFPPINDVLAWTRLKSGSKQMAAYYTTVTEVADQVAKILQGGGTGSGTSDAKLHQAQEMFDKGFSKEQIQGVAEALGPLLENRRSSMIGDNPFLQHQFSKKKTDGQLSDEEILNKLNKLK